VRIIAGELRGRTFDAPPGRGTRPTTDQVREAIFSILGDLGGAMVIDLFAGSGALGLEALSRGAARAVFVESSKRALATLRKNVRALGVASRAAVVGRRVEQCASAVAVLGPFDVVLCDPPWLQMQASERALARFLRAPPLRPAARLVLGHPKRHELELPADAPLSRSSRRTWGDAAASFFTWTGSATELGAPAG